MSTIPDAAIEAACWSIDPVDGPTDEMRQFVRAAMPAIREAIAQDVEAECYRTEGFTNGTYYDGVDAAARIVRDGTP